MSTKILNFQEEKKRREYEQLMKARYGAMLLAEISFADEAEGAPRQPNDPKPDGRGS
jgi:hypothetical protein